MATHNLDMFTYLKDSILFIIISFLPFKEAARTCILSRRWRNIWRGTRNIELDESFFVKLEDSNENQEIQRQVFIDFIRQWIQNYRKPVVDKFRLAVSRPQNFLADMQQCVTFAVSRSVKVLSLEFSDPAWRDDDLENHEALFDLPSHVYGHSILESLKLFSCNFSLSEFRNFTALKQLSLGWIELRVSSLKAVLSQCQLLESLSLKKCWNVDHLDISVPNLRLKSLVVDKCNFLQNWFGIEAPNLQFFKYSGTLGVFEIEINRCMEEADLDFALEFEFDELGDLLYKLLESLHCVRILHVCSYMLQVLPHGTEPLSMSFPMSVTHLILNTTLHINELCGIAFMLKSCPSLETLSIQIVPSRIFDDYTLPYKFVGLFVYKSLKRTLKVVEVRGFTGSKNEMYLLKYIVEHGRVMEQLTVSISKDSDHANGGNTEIYVQRAQMVQQFQRASPCLNVLIC